MSLAVPTWACELQASGWANIHSIVESPPRLSGVDAFLGDVKAETLVLGKDSAPASVFKKLVVDGHPDPYRHDPTLPTNRMLERVLRDLGFDARLDGSTSATCGVYYANAYWLLRDDDRFSGPLKNADEAFVQSRPIMSYMFAELPRLKRIVALGADSYAALMRFYDLKEDWRSNLHQRRCVQADGRRLYASSHLGYFGVRMRMPKASPEVRYQTILDDWKSAFDA